MTDTIARRQAAEAGPPPDERAQGVRGLVLLIAGIVALGLLTGVSIVIVILAIIVMVFLHELGHYLTAKWAGMKVTEFFIGFGPRIWSFRRGETEYGVKAIPAGAYVRVVGMSNLEEVPPEDEPRTYRQQSFPRRLSVAVAGSTMHLLIAIVCLYAVLVTYGAPNGHLVDTRSPEQIDRETPWVVDEVVRGSAAEQAGLRPDDRILAVDGEPVEGFGDIGEAVRSRPGEAITLTISRDGRELDVGATLGERDGVGFLGISPDRQIDITDYGPIEAAPRALDEAGRLGTESVKALVRFFSPSGLSDFGDQLADAGREDGRDTTGTGGGTGGGSSDDDGRVVSIVGATRLGAELFESGAIGFLLFLAMLNMFIGIFNMVPLLPLDGGHVAIAVYERLRSRGGRRYHADVSKLMPITYVVVLLLVVLGITTLYLDIADPISLE